VAGLTAFRIEGRRRPVHAQPPQRRVTLGHDGAMTPIAGRGSVTATARTSFGAWLAIVEGQVGVLAEPSPTVIARAHQTRGREQL
jgi:hypothetical protein